VRTVKLIVEYDGSRFHGWQKQPGLRTIQGELERVLSLVMRAPSGSLCAAGRTDAGVHARGQVVTFRSDRDLDFRAIANGVSHLMKGELTVLSIEYAPEGFHPGISSTHKQYSYRILNRQTPPVLDAHMVWHISQPLDLDRMQEDAKALVGTQDFSAFRDSTCTAKSTVKTIYESYLERDGELITYYVVGTGFLKQMVRNIVGTLTDIGRGRIRDRTFGEILAGLDRRRAGVTAPPHGLSMDWVAYPFSDSEREQIASG
jgi:tRNA pseudouridine38-40 synthase